MSTSRRKTPCPETTGQLVARMRRRLPSRRLHLLFWLPAAIGAAADLWSKHAVFAWLRAQGTRRYELIEGLLAIVEDYNPGAAFSMARDRTALLIAFSAVAAVAIIAVFLLGSMRTRLAVFAMGMFLGGVFGNLYDRVFNDGLVRDFIFVYYRWFRWPAFNVADSLLVIAVALLFIAGFRDRPSRTPAGEQK